MCAWSDRRPGKPTDVTEPVEKVSMDGWSPAYLNFMSSEMNINVGCGSFLCKLVLPRINHLMRSIVRLQIGSG